MAKRDNSSSAAKQRSGTEDVGMEYQYNVITYMAAAMSENPIVDNYSIFSNLPEIPGFDDLILKVWYKGESHPHVHLGQIKHRSSKINFETEKHKLADYKRDVVQIINNKDRIEFLQDVPNDNITFIFYTNSTLKKSKAIIIDKQVPYVPLLCNVEPDVHGSKFPVKVSKYFYKFLPHHLNSIDEEDSLFINKIRLLLNQSCNRKIIYDIINIYKEDFSKEMTLTITRYVREYFRIPTVTNITKDVFETELFRIRLSKYIMPPTKAVKMNVEQARIWNQITLDYDITLVNDSDNVEDALCGCFSQRINDLYNCDFKWNDCINKSRRLCSDFSMQSFVDRSKANGRRYWLNTPDTIDSLLLEMWKYADIPLILKVDGEISVLGKYKHLIKKIILICDVKRKYKELKTLDLKIFASVTDIRDAEERSRLLANIQVSLQGRQPASLEEITDQDEQCMKELNSSEILCLIQQKRQYLDAKTLKKVELMIIIKTVTDEEIEETEILAVNDSIHKNIVITCHNLKVEEYTKLISEHHKFRNYSIYRLQDSSYGLKFISGDQNKLKSFFVDENRNRLLYCSPDKSFPLIGNILGRHEHAYISRSLRTPIIDKSILSGKPRIYLLCGNVESLDNATRMNIIKITHFISDITLINDENTFIDVRDCETQGINLDVHYLKTTYPIVFLKVVEGNFLLLSYKNCNDLFAYISYGRNIISEDVFFEASFANNKIIVISGEAGMGKTALLHSLSQAYDKRCFVLFCDLTDYTQELKQPEKVKFELDYLFNKYTQRLSCYKNLLYAIYKYHTSKGKVILFIDSFDEVLPVYKREVLQFIQDIAKTNIRIIIASRTIAKKLLFNQMEIYPLTIAKLNADHIETYLMNRNLNSIELRTMPKEFLANPLYLTFFIFLSERKKVDFTSIDLVSLYKMVILEKIERYHNKIGLLYNKEMEYLNEEVLEVHRLIALVAIFGEEWLVSKKIIKNYQKLVNQLNSQKIKLGIVKDFCDGYPVFIHKTIAEFLVAEWLDENLPEEGGAGDIYKTVLTKYYNNIQYFLDNMACKNLELHMAVIKGDLALVQDLCSKDYIRIDDVDKCGRNSLHLASSYCLDERNYKIMETVLSQMLREKYDFNARDKYMEYNWLDYLQFRNSGFFERACSFGATTVVKVYLKLQKKLIFNSDVSNALLNGSFHTLLFLFEVNRTLLAEHFERAFNIAIDRGCTSTACELIRLQCGNNPRFKVFLNVCQNYWPIANKMNIEYMAEMKIINSTPLHVACLHGNAKLIKKLLQCGPQGVTAIDVCRRTLLHYAILQGSCDVVSLLLEFQETNINAKDEYEQTPLHLAVKHSNLKMVRLLLEKGASVSEKNYDGETVLMFAAARNMPNICRFILEYDTNVDEINANGSSAFLIAAERGHLNVLRLLLCYGADIAQKDCWENTALHLACFQGHGNIVDLMVKKSRDLISSRNKSDLTPLEIVIISQNLSIVEILQNNEETLHADNKNDPLTEESFDTNEGYTPLHLAKSAEEVRLQFDSVKMNDINVRAHNGDTPLHVACRCGYVNVVEALLSAQANISMSNNLGEAPLHLAVQNNKLNVVRILLNHGAKINSVDNYIETPLHIAVKNQNISIVRVLLEKGIHVNRQNYDGRSALHMAVKRHETDIAETLLCSGANMYQLDFCNKTALHIAVEYENAEVVKVLLEFAIAKNDYVDVCGNTPLHIAVINQNVNIVKMLIKHGAIAFRPNAEGITAIHIAASMHNSIIQHMLLQSVTDADDFCVCKDAALRIAVLQSDIKMALAILERGADINYTNEYNESALHVAARQRNVDMIKMLLDKGADINCLDIFMATPLHIAAMYEDPQILQMLLENGADVNRFNKSNDAALHIALNNQDECISEMLLRFNANIRYDKKALFLAVKHQNMEILEMLLKYGLEKRKAQQPALNTAIENGNLNIAKLLLEDGIDFSSVDFPKESPLHVAAEKGSIEGVKLLLKQGMDINFMDCYKKSALHIAVEKENLDMVNFLLDNRIYLNMVNHLQQSALYLAARLGNAKITEVLLEKGIDIDRAEHRNKTALHIAVENEHTNVVHVLLENNINVNLLNFRNQNALFAAVWVQNLELVKILLERGADTNLYDVWGRSPLYLAVEIENLDIVKQLLIYDTNPNHMDAPRESALHCAVEKKCMEIIKSLLKAGMNINISDHSGGSALHVAIKKNNFNIAQYLLKCGLDLNHWKDPLLHAAIEEGNKDIVKLLLDNLVHVNSRNSLKESALHIAAKKLNGDIMKLLLDFDININAVDVHKQSALHFAILAYDEDIKRSNTQPKMRVVDVTRLLESQSTISQPPISNRINCIRLLLDKGININLIDEQQRSALHLATEHLHEEVAMILLDNEADVNLADNLGNTVLHFAAQCQSVNAIEVILRKTTDINKANTSGRTALHVSVQNQCEGIVRMLLEKGADPNTLDNSMLTPLSIATKNCDFVIVKMLLENGAEVNYVDDRKQSILHFAVECGNVELVQLILNNGGDINQSDFNSKTPLDIAGEFGYADIVKVLLQYKTK